MDEEILDLAITIMKEKIAKEIKENKENNFKNFKIKIQKLKQEEKEIYKKNETIINKVLTEYAKDIKTK